MAAEAKLDRQRLSVLALAEALRNVSALGQGLRPIAPKTNARKR